ncbi:MAG: PrsW family glutamic-type intramembrane protease [Proteobacteria bacterium]|nr:PrsW family glutamic-type intramembrane protease [Pseudomonadota bacterium]
MIASVESALASLEVYLTLHTPIAVLPVLALLACLVWLDSFKLVAARHLLLLIGVGGLATVAAYFVNAFVFDFFPHGFVAFSRYVSPFIEELLKSLAIIVLIRYHRIGLLVDAAIAGFAVGTGFALLENLFHLGIRTEPLLLIQVIRGFGTAIMHGGATAAFALTAIAILERYPTAGVMAFLPAYLLAAVLHSTFNHLLIHPPSAVALMTVVFPVVFVVIFRFSERRLRGWMESGLAAKMQMLSAFQSGNFLATPAGEYLRTLRTRFDGEVLADMLCYIRLHAELSLRAQGILMMRETGWGELPQDPDTRQRLSELKHLARAIGTTGLLALHPLLMAKVDIRWQVALLGGSQRTIPRNSRRTERLR